MKMDSTVLKEIKGNQAFKDKQEAKERWVKRASKVRLITQNIQLSAEDGVMFLRHMLFEIASMRLSVGEAAIYGISL